MSTDRPSSRQSQTQATNGDAPKHSVRHRKKARTHSATSAELARLKPSKSTPKPVDWEIPRKTLHSSIGFFTWYLYAAQGNPRVVIYALSLALCLIVPLDVLRLNSSRFEKLYERVVGFLMRESEKKSTNGVIWYITGVLFVLSVYPLDIATVSILILSWADTAASTFGRLWGRYTPPLPRSISLIPFVPFARLPLAPRKSFAGFLAGSVTGAAITVTFWGFCYPVHDAQLNFHLPLETLALVQEAVPATSSLIQQGINWVESVDLPLGRWLGLTTLGVVSGLISGTAEALDLGSLDDNLTLPIISGGCIWGFFKLIEFFNGFA
ncbi:uncharacterized protein BXZ73DRAFT_51542 [Epithele typhae]|uniref:uncharacterized protein n=1 Tax=Epithele typhae TaxID=378194 RepID=UPI002008989D|nr:uncharacterized protein BXZ73DRAFT_51542 [Epithele typhae]KAH9921934.1 hypothetical protein BXZ73DRAFT_51542 [Epithele typhae]